MKKTLLFIVISQFFGTSLWFSSNAVLLDIAKAHQLDSANLLTYLTIATQLGFIIGSLFYAIFNIADRYKANLVFSLSISLGALANGAILFPHLSFNTVFLFRFLTGLFLAGVYPVGMKIAAHFFPKTVSNALGVLVAALVLGTAFPHFIASFHINLSWTTVITTSSILAILGGIIMLFLNTPAKKEIQKIDFTIIPKLFQKKDFRAACFGYFGHMWELYTFWAFVPLLVNLYTSKHHLITNTSLWVFIIISTGALGCIVAGKMALKKNSLNVAKFSMYVSAFCCLLCPISLYFSPIVFLVYLLIWGFFVVADSPLLSTLVNRNCDKNYNGTGLTLSTSIGFSFTIISIGLFNYLQNFIPISYIFMILAIGPLLGILALNKKTLTSKSNYLTKI